MGKVNLKEFMERINKFDFKKGEQKIAAERINIYKQLS